MSTKCSSKKSASERQIYKKIGRKINMHKIGKAFTSHFFAEKQLKDQIEQ